MKFNIKESNVKENGLFIHKLLDLDLYEKKQIETMSETTCSYSLYDDEDKWIGGITGFTRHQEFHIALLAVDSYFQGNGFGEMLLKKCEEYAIKQGCSVITVTTQDFQAPKFYPKYGYQVIGEIVDCPFIGATKYFFYKRINSKNKIVPDI